VTQVNILLAKGSSIQYASDFQGAVITKGRQVRKSRLMTGEIAGASRLMTERRRSCWELGKSPRKRSE
jgi:hypothetical protein